MTEVEMMVNIVYYKNTPFYTPETYTNLFNYAEFHGKKSMREYVNTFSNQFNTDKQAGESLRNIDTKMYFSAEIMIAMELEKKKEEFVDRYGFSGNFYVSSTANGIDIVYAEEPIDNCLTGSVKHLEAKCTNGSYKKHTRGNVVRPINEDGYYLQTNCAWKYHLTKTHNPNDAFNSLLDEFNNMDAIHAVLTMENNVKSVISELWFINGENIKYMLTYKRTKQNLIQINPSSFYTFFKDKVELIG